MSCCGGSCTCGKGEKAKPGEITHLVHTKNLEDSLPSFDWSKAASGLSLEVELVEVRFKNMRKVFFRNVGGLDLAKDDRVVVEDTSGGFDLGTITLAGKDAREKFESLGEDAGLLNKVVRKASIRDLENWLQAKTREFDVLHMARKLSLDRAPGININDVEFRGDGKKATLYYSAENPIESQGLAELCAKTFLVEVELKEL